jgi:hypothetical protein
MKHDESALVKQALRDAREQLQARGRILPGAYMLVRKNPQTGAPLTHPTAIGSVLEQPLASPGEFAEFVEQLRGESARLAAVAVAFGAEAEAEIETASGSAVKRVWYLRVEDEQGMEQLHAVIETEGDGPPRLGKLMADAGATDLLGAPLLTKSGPGMP